MDPVISRIYRSFFDQEMRRTVGTPNSVALLSSLQDLEQNLDKCIPYGYPISQYNVIDKYNKTVTGIAFNFVKRYSTFTNL